MAPTGAAAAAAVARDFKQGDLAWVPEETDGFVLVEFNEACKTGQDRVSATVKGVATRQVSLSAAQTAQAEPADAEALKTVEDMVKLADLREASILYNLRERFAVDDIYSKIGTILVAVNPFRPVPLYTPEILEAYALAGSQQLTGGEISMMPPHVFQVTDQAYRQLTTTLEAQACLVSGESGAGKTESVKLLLQFLTVMSGRTASEDWGEQGRLQEQILKANPLMEAFGNAKTVRNNNSSRFGKFIDVQFNARLGTITGAAIEQYLLEKSRIVYQSPRERNYHVFYQLCAGALTDEALRKQYHVQKVDRYRILMHPEASANIHDEHGFEETVTAMHVLGMTSQERDDLLRTVSAVLHVGNLTFAKKDMPGVDFACDVADRSVLEIAAYLVGVQPDELASALTRKKLSVGNQKDLYQQYSIAQAEDVRDALAKSLYGNMFDWLIKRINWSLKVASKSAQLGQQLAHQTTAAATTSATSANEVGETRMERVTSMSSAMIKEFMASGGANNAKAKAAANKKDDAIKSIGVLDIFGFESFETNSFEQLCINYCNEKLQGYFTEHIFKLEQNEYAVEGIPVDVIAFKDNAPILEMLETKRTGLFALIDEEMNVPKGTDETFLNKATKAFEKHPNFKKALKSPIQFVVTHFAGDVIYTVTSFLAKNKDTVPGDIQTLVERSGHRFVRVLFAGYEGEATRESGGVQPTTLGGGGGGGGGAGRATVAPGGAGAGAGGSSKRSLITQFKDQLAQLMTNLNNASPHFIRCVKPNKELVGRKFDGAMVLEQLRYAGLLEVCKIRKSGFPVRKEHAYAAWRFNALLPKGAVAAGARSKAQDVMSALQSRGVLQPAEWRMGKTKVFLRSETYDRLERLRDAAVHDRARVVQCIARGRGVRRWYAKCRALLKKIEADTAAKNIEAIEADLIEAGELPYQGKHLKQVVAARKMMQVVQEERRVEALLLEAIKADRLDALETAVNAAKSLNYASPTLKQAEAQITALRDETASLEQLRAALNSRDLATLEAAVTKVERFPRLANDAALVQAKGLVAKIRLEVAAIQALQAAIKSGDVALVTAKMQAAGELGLYDHPAMAEGARVAKVQAERSALFQQRVDDTVAQAKAALEPKKRRVSALKRVRDAALELNLLGSANADPAVKAVIQALDELEKGSRLTGQLQAERRALALKAGRVNGLKKDDMAELERALEAAKAGGVPADDPELVESAAAVQRGYDQIKAQDALRAVIADNAKMKDYDALKAILATCEGIPMTTVDVYITVRERMLDLEEKRNKGQLTAEARPVLTAEMSEDQIEEINRKRLKKAANPGFHYGNYYRLRSDADFAKGIMFNKSKPINMKLSHQSEPIHKSLLNIPPEFSRQAVRLNRSILGYCGDQVMSFPASLAQDLVDKVLILPELADEIYMQLMKHVTDNPEPQSEGRGWQLICVCVGAFPPSEDFEMYLLNFLLAHEKKDGIVGTYAKYAIRKLQSTVMFGATEGRVSIEEIVAYGDRPPVMATVSIIDGTPITENFPVGPHMNVDDVMRICVQFLALKDQRQEYFGLYVVERKVRKQEALKNDQSIFETDKLLGKSTGEAMPDMLPPPPPGPGGVAGDLPPPPPPPPAFEDDLDDDIPPRTSYPVQPDEFLGDIVMAVTNNYKAEKFVFKRKIFLPATDGRGKDPIYNRLIYLQCLEEVFSGNWHVPAEATVVELAAIAMAVDVGDELPTTPGGLIDEGLPEYLPTTWRDTKPIAQWAQLVVKRTPTYAPQEVDDLQFKFTQMVSELPSYGSTLFFVRRQEFGSDFIALINARGLQVVTLKERKQVMEFPYVNLKRFSGTASTLMLETKDAPPQKVTLWTSQAKAMAGLMLQYHDFLESGGHLAKQAAPVGAASKKTLVGVDMSRMLKSGPGGAVVGGAPPSPMMGTGRKGAGAGALDVPPPPGGMLGGRRMDLPPPPPLLGGRPTMMPAGASAGAPRGTVTQPKIELRGFAPPPTPSRTQQAAAQALGGTKKKF